MINCNCMGLPPMVCKTLSQLNPTSAFGRFYIYYVWFTCFNQGIQFSKIFPRFNSGWDKVQVNFRLVLLIAQHGQSQNSNSQSLFHSKCDRHPGYIYIHDKISLKSYLAKNEAAAEEWDPDPVELVLPGLMGEAGLLGIRGLRGGDPMDPKCGA